MYFAVSPNANRSMRFFAHVAAEIEAARVEVLPGALGAVLGPHRDGDPSAARWS